MHTALSNVTLSAQQTLRAVPKTVVIAGDKNVSVLTENIVRSCYESWGNVRSRLVPEKVRPATRASTQVALNQLPPITFVLVSSA